MRCKPGQLARIVAPADPALRGKIVTTITVRYSYRDMRALPVWQVDRELQYRCSRCGWLHRTDRIPDEELEPLFDPGAPEVTTTDKELEHV